MPINEREERVASHSMAAAEHTHTYRTTQNTERYVITCSPNPQQACNSGTIPGSIILIICNGTTLCCTVLSQNSLGAKEDDEAEAEDEAVEDVEDDEAAEDAEDAQEDDTAGEDDNEAAEVAEDEAAEHAEEDEAAEDTTGEKEEAEEES